MYKYLTPFAVCLAGASAGLTGGLPALAQDSCGYFQMAEMNWASGALMANVDALILEHGYGCDIELVPGATQTEIFESMNERGTPDVVPEFWANAVGDSLYAAFDAGGLHLANRAPITDLGEGWYITPAFAAAHPELDTVLKILERPDLFPDYEDPSKGAFVGCPARWSCHPTNVNMFRAFDMAAKGWKLLDPGSSAGLSGSMAKAAERGENWFGYYWSPTALIGKYGMVKVPFGVADAGSDHWDNCILKPECADPQKTSWTKSVVHTVVNDNFKKTAGGALLYLEKRVFPGDVMNEMLLYMQDELADGEDAALYFLKTHQELWQSWLPSDVAGKVEGALF